MEQVEVNIDQARTLAFNSQVESKISMSENTQESIGEIVDKLGYVQIDTINVINRAHHHTLWTRLPKYSIEDVYSAQREDRSIFEYWGHAMSYLSMRDFRYYLPRMKKFLDPYSKWESERLKKSAHLLEPVIQRIKKEGPLCSGDFKSERKTKSNGWWDWRPYKVALEILFWQGKLMVTERRKFQKFYDLTERVLPDWVDTKMPSDEELGRYFVQKALNSLGLAKEKEIIDHIDIGNLDLLRSSIQKLLEQKEIVELKLVINNSAQQYFILPENLDKLDSLSPPSEVFVFSPFDNFVINRSRLNELFNFQYTLECYLKPEQRKFGYFVLPIFSKNKFVGKMDAKADRKEKILLIQQLFFENDFKIDDTFLSSFGEKLKKFMLFQGCNSIKFINIHHRDFPVERFNL